MTVDYWLGYWIAAFEHVRDHREVVIPISYEALCARPQAVFGNLLEQLGIVVDDRSVDTAAASFHLPSKRPTALRSSSSSVPPQVFAEPPWTHPQAWPRTEIAGKVTELAFTTTGICPFLSLPMVRI